MYKLIFDSNSYNMLNKQLDLRDKIRNLVNENKLIVIVPSTISKELENSPFEGVPNWFTTERIGDSVFLTDYSLTDLDRVGDGEIYNLHKGNSRKFKDALIADTAHTNAVLFVSEDYRCRERLKNISDLCHSLTFAEFSRWINSINWESELCSSLDEEDNDCNNERTRT